LQMQRAFSCKEVPYGHEDAALLKRMKEREL